MPLLPSLVYCVEDVLGTSGIQKVLIVQDPVLQLGYLPAENVWILEVLLVPIRPGERYLEELGVASEESSTCTVLINLLEEAAPRYVVEREISLVLELVTQRRVDAVVQNHGPDSALALSEFVAYLGRIVVAALKRVIQVEPGDRRRLNLRIDKALLQERPESEVASRDWR